MNNFESVSDDSDGFDFFTSISTGELHGANESFYDWGKSFSEFFSLISASSVWYEDLRFGGFNGNIILEAWIINLID